MTPREILGLPFYSSKSLLVRIKESSAYRHYLISRLGFFSRSNKRPNCSFLLASRGRPEVLEECLINLLKIKYPDDEVLILLHKPDKAYLDIKIRYADRVGFISVTKECSLSHLWNQLIRRARYSDLFILNDKARPSRRKIQKALRLSRAGIGFVGLYRFGCFYLSKYLIYKVGWFEERFADGGYEDDDFMRKVAEANIALYENEEVSYLQKPSLYRHQKSKIFFEKKWSGPLNNVRKLKDIDRYRDVRRSYKKYKRDYLPFEQSWLMEMHRNWFWKAKDIFAHPGRRQNIMLFTPAPPCTAHSGSLMLYQMSKLIKGKANLSCFCASDPLAFLSRSAIDPGLKIPYRAAMRPIERALRFNRKPTDRVSYYFEVLKSFYINEVLIPRAIRFARRHNVDKIWAVVQGRTIISSAEALAKALGVELITQVWDDPSWILADTRLDKQTKAETLFQFDSLIASSSVCATASWAMAEDYRKKYKVSTTVLVGSLPKNYGKASHRLSSRELTIGLAGQIYALDEWSALIDALQGAGWTVNEKLITIKLIGNFKMLKIPQGARVEKLGRVSQKKAIDLVSHMDIGYCPYWFDKKFENVARTSFPSKLTTYLAAGVPTLFHGPSYSSPARFVKLNQCGIVCESLRPKDLLDAIASLANEQVYEKMAKQAGKTFVKNLTLDNFSRAVDQTFKL